MEEKDLRATERNGKTQPIKKERKQDKEQKWWWRHQADSKKKKKQRQPKKRGIEGWRKRKEGNKNRQLKTTSEGGMNYASAWLEDRRKPIWRGGDARLIQSPFISTVTFLTSPTPTKILTEEESQRKGRRWNEKWACEWKTEEERLEKRESRDWCVNKRYSRLKEGRSAGKNK